MEHENVDPLLADIIGVETKGPRPKEFRPPPPVPDENELEKFFQELELGMSTSASPTEPGTRFEKRYTGVPVAKRVTGPSGWTNEYDETGALIRGYAPGIDPERAFGRD